MASYDLMFPDMITESTEIACKCNSCFMLYFRTLLTNIGPVLRFGSKKGIEHIICFDNCQLMPQINASLNYCTISYSHSFGNII